MTTAANDLDRHMSETADMARAAMADMLTAVSMSARRMTPGAALQSSSSLQAVAARLNDALVSAEVFLSKGDDGNASVDAARAMSLSDYASRLARLRTIAAQMSAYDDAQSGSAS
jgi:hypothetical protein